MIRYIIVSADSGIPFGAMDTLINDNPLAPRLYDVRRPISAIGRRVVREEHAYHLT